MVFATSGEAGAVPAWSPDDLAGRRRREAIASCAHLGVDRVEFLDHRDSGASGLGSFASGTLAAADPEAIAGQVVDLLDRRRTSRPSPPTTRSASTGTPITSPCTAPACTSPALGTPVYEATVDTRRVRTVRERLVGRRILAPWLWPADETDRLGTRRSDELLTADVTADLPGKLAALAEHSSQVLMARTFMGVPAGAFHHLLGHEDFVPACEPRSAELRGVAPRSTHQPAAAIRTWGW